MGAGVGGGVCVCSEAAQYLCLLARALQVHQGVRTLHCRENQTAQQNTGKPLSGQSVSIPKQTSNSSQPVGFQVVDLLPDEDMG